MMRGRKQTLLRTSRKRLHRRPRVPSPGCTLHLRGPQGLVGFGRSPHPKGGGGCSPGPRRTQLPCHASSPRTLVRLLCVHVHMVCLPTELPAPVPHDGGTRLCAPLPVLPQGGLEFKWVLQTSSRTHWPPGVPGHHQSPSMAWPRPTHQCGVAASTNPTARLLPCPSGRGLLSGDSPPNLPRLCVILSPHMPSTCEPCGRTQSGSGEDRLRVPAGEGGRGAFGHDAPWGSSLSPPLPSSRSQLPAYSPTAPPTQPTASSGLHCFPLP